MVSTLGDRACGQLFRKGFSDSISIVLVNIKSKHGVDLTEPNLNDLLADGVGASAQVSLCQRSANSWNVLICSGFDATVITAHSVHSSSNKAGWQFCDSIPVSLSSYEVITEVFLGEVIFGHCLMPSRRPSRSITFVLEVVHPDLACEILEPGTSLGPMSPSLALLVALEVCVAYPKLGWC